MLKDDRKITRSHVFSGNKFTLANSPYSSMALSLYALAASISFSNCPSRYVTWFLLMTEDYSLLPFDVTKKISSFFNVFWQHCSNKNNKP